MNGKCVIYVRASARNTDRSQMLQVVGCASLAKAHGRRIDWVYTDYATGLNDAGEELQRLLSDCATGEVSAIYISSRDRISRDEEHLARFTEKTRSHDVAVIFLEDAALMAVDKV